MSIVGGKTIEDNSFIFYFKVDLHEHFQLQLLSLYLTFNITG